MRYCPSPPSTASLPPHRRPLNASDEGQSKQRDHEPGKPSPSTGPAKQISWLQPWSWPLLRRHVRLALLATGSFVTVLALALAFCLVVFPDRGDQPSVIVDLGYAKYAGKPLQNGINQFLSMRYATPPAGNLRWRAPISPQQERAPRRLEPAFEFGPICHGIGTGLPFLGQDEDCLFVNVWAPAKATPQSNLPVWVFISGGGFFSLTNANWNGSEVVQNSGGNIVFVNFNYRVGLWGFLASDRVQRDGNLNAGMLDQRMLLTWVKQHIALFGGNPNHVVIHGTSAGAGSVALHQIAYGGRNDGLFVGGIAESIFLPAQPPVADLEWQFDRVVNQTGCASQPLSLQMTCLRNTDAATLQDANFAQAFPGRTDAPLPLFYWTPTVDGDFLRDVPYVLYERGQFIRMPMLFGSTTNEGTIFADNAASQGDVKRFFQNNYPKLSDNDTDAILAQYPGPFPRLPQHDAFFPTASDAYGEATLICPGVNVLNQVLKQTSQKSQIFSYRYNVQDDDNTAQGLGVWHIFEAAAVFGPANIGGSRPSYESYNAAVIPEVMSYWTSFVRALDPSPFRNPGSPVWGSWGGGGVAGSRLVIETNKSRMEVTPSDQVARCAFWESMGKADSQQ